jgi:hypothetical protein
MKSEKIYLAYEGYFDKLDQQDLRLLGCYRNKEEAIARIEESIKEHSPSKLEDIEIEESGSSIYWTETGWEIFIAGKLEERELI